MTDFRSVLCAAGLRPRDIVADGRWRRCATDDKPTKRNGAYVLHADGRGYWRNWATDSDVSVFADDAVAHRARHIDTAAMRKQERLARIAAMRAARRYWDESRPLTRLHPYIERKGLSALGCSALRSNDGHLVVPVWHAGWIISVQTIHPDGTKRFFAGAPVKGGSFVIDRSRAALTCVVEGLATGLAVYQAVRNARVIVAFDAGNLLPALAAIKPTGNVVICADNDHATQQRRGFNPGLEKASIAAEHIGCGVAWPMGIEGTDWADAMKEIGIGAARKIERQILSASKYVATG